MRKSILIIDDDKQALDLLTDLFLKEGFYRALGLATGEGIGAIIKEKNPDIILLDTTIGNEDPIKILREIKSSFAHIPVLILADKHDVGIAEKALRSGAASYIVKSEEDQQFVKKVAQEFDRISQPSASKAGRLLVLIIDDDKDISEMIKSFLEKSNYACQTVTDAKMALQAIRSNKPDIVFLDIVMPGINGLDLLMEIRSVNKGLKIVMMSGVSDHDVCLAAMKNGANGYITKPFSLQQLTATIVSMLLK